ncbi:MAG TPA: chlorophyll synthase ChlG [Kouleothrix sp.]|uniref:chlorophyll synthase ChlG n=1 Tax=Kouleothrix sp. TaxID=2779161 RepID=UPI002C9E10BE|nr:chlorophyll synthase ChlG [Kouleothrix sp.]HRC74134.1 chlorophyll synthase ChlG [Kouleothrix sp.]
MQTPLASPSPIAPKVPASPLARSIALMKPVTWFAPAWAFLCGTVASGGAGWHLADIGRIMLGVLLSGPILCGLSQVINDYCDREVDAINEPQRLIPSGLVSARQVYLTSGVLAVLAIGIALILGAQVTLLTAVGMVLALVYSVHPLRAKRNGWIGNGLVAVAYEGLPWLAGHLAFGSLTIPSLIIAGLYSVGAHGIMTINDFKSVDGDRVSGVNTIPVMLGSWGAAWVAVLTMNIAQLFVIMLFAVSQRWIIAAIIAALFVAQLPLQRKFMQDPRGRAVFYNASGTTLFVWGMLAAAIGIR